MTTERIKPRPAIMIPLGPEYAGEVLTGPFVFDIGPSDTIEIGETRYFQIEVDGERIRFKAVCTAIIDGGLVTFEKVVD